MLAVLLLHQGGRLRGPSCREQRAGGKSLEEEELGGGGAWGRSLREEEPGGGGVWGGVWRRRGLEEEQPGGGGVWRRRSLGESGGGGAWGEKELGGGA